MVVDKLLTQRLLLNVDLGYSDHLAQILYIKINKFFNILKYTQSFTENNIQGFNFLLRKESWEEVLVSQDVDSSNFFMDKIAVTLTF
jgi:hypothetical protein